MYQKKKKLRRKKDIVWKKEEFCIKMFKNYQIFVELFTHIIPNVSSNFQRLKKEVEGKLKKTQHK